MAAETLVGVSVLLVEDEALLSKRLGAMLMAKGAEVTMVGSCGEAAELLAEIDYDVVVLDVNLPDGRGTDLLRDGKIPESSAAVVITAEGGVEGVVEAMRLGAVDYLAKPFDPTELPVRVSRARRMKQAERADDFQREGVGTGREPEVVFGGALAPVEAMLRQIIAADERRRTELPPVLIEGETGTGKTTIARWLHRRGPRASGPLVEVNCAALPEALAESELFGHERGAVSDARTARIGLIEAADGGTLFLDELPSLPAALQAKLLTVIEDHQVRRLGANKGKQVDVRIIAATHTPLKTLVDEGKFREDLMHRLDLFRVKLPPLRERGEDIGELAGVLITRVARNYGITPVPALPAAGLARLRAYPWSGNVRELAHEIERALVFEGAAGLRFERLENVARESGQAETWLREGFVFPPGGFSLERAINEFIQRALAQTNGNVTAAARLLGVTRDYVRYHLRAAEGGGFEENDEA